MGACLQMVANPEIDETLRLMVFIHIKNSVKKTYGVSVPPL